MWIEVFKSGTHTDSNGNQSTYDSDSLYNIVSNYNNKIRDKPNLKMPLVNEHNKDSKSIGQINQLLLNNDVVMADVDITDDNILQKIKDNKIQNVSVGLNELELTHIGILESQLPAIEGLKPIQETAELSNVNREVNPTEELISSISEVGSNLSPISIELANRIINNLQNIPKETFNTIKDDLIRFVEDLNKSYLTKEYSHNKIGDSYQYKIQFPTTIVDRNMLHLEIINYLKNNPELSYEQAMLKIIK